MASDLNGAEIEAGEVYAIAGRVRGMDGDSVLIVVGQDGHEQVLRVAASDVIPVPAGLELNPASFTGALSGSGVSTLQQLAAWIDAHVTP